MYLTHFGFSELPFSLTPDTDFFFESASHAEALNTLHAALRLGEGFIKVTAEIGLGKTLLCRLLLRQLDDGFVTAYVPDPLLSPRSLRVALAEELSLAVDNDNTDAQLLGAIQRQLLGNAANGRRTVLVIDEAHQLASETLESIRLLTNLETEKAKLLQVVVVGQPELDRRLCEPALRQLRQRISFDCTLQPLNLADTATYIAHRLARAGDGETPAITPEAVAAVYKASRGTPRLINMLCHKALLAAWGTGVRRVHETHARRAIADSQAAVREAGASRLPWRPWALLPRALRPAGLVAERCQ
ncbi:MAG: AAA family ATPase [Pseudomonadota bacterium]